MIQTSDKGRRELAAMVLIAVLPFVIAALLFFIFPNEEISSQEAREGLEIEQVLQINAIAAGGKWRILHLVEDTCDYQCEEAFFLTRQTRKALGKYAGEVHRIALTAKDLNPDFMNLLAQDHRSLSLVSDPKIFSELLGLAPDGFRGHRVFLLDPLGKVVMFFSEKKLGKPLLKDLRYLLRISRMG